MSNIDVEYAIYELSNAIDRLRKADVMTLFNNRHELRAAYDELFELLYTSGLSNERLSKARHQALESVVSQSVG